MLSRSIYRRLAGAGSICLLVFTTRAEEPGGDASTNQPAALRTSIKSEEVIGGTNARPIQRAYFNVGTNQFSFVIPEDFKLDASNPHKIVLTSPDYACFIAVQLVNPGSSAAGSLVVDSFRNLAADEFPEGTLINEFVVHAANRTGPAYEFRWKNSAGAQQQACAGFVPSGAGFLKFSLLSNSEMYPANVRNFRGLLRSFQSNENGKLEILPVSGAS